MIKKIKKILISALAVVIAGGIIFFGFTPLGRSIIVDWQYALTKPNEDSYKNRKKVEDQCRSMIASYNSDKLAYYQYKDSESELERNYAQSYKQRANSTAATYNEFYLKNSYVWKDHVPEDIVKSLPYIED